MTFAVDVHHHMLPDFFWRATNEGNPELTTSEQTAVLSVTATTLIPRLATVRPQTRPHAS